MGNLLFLTVVVAAPHLDRVISDVAALSSIVYVSYSARTFRRETRRMKQDSATAQAQSQHFEDVLKGVEAGPGIEARPSLVQRMAALEASHQALNIKTDQQNVILAKILGLLTPNHGSSLPDKVDFLNESMLSHLETHAKPENRPNPQRNRRSPRPKPTTEGEKQ